MHRTSMFLGLCLLWLGTGVAFAQNAAAPDTTLDNGKTFNLKHTSMEEQKAEKAAAQAKHVEYVPIISERNLEATLTLGFLMLDKTLLEHKNMIYKYTDKNTYYGDVVINGQRAFNPQLRLNYNILPWFAVEPVLGFSVSEYTAKITNPRSLSNQAVGEGQTLQPVEEIGQYDPENRSIITLSSGLNGIFYPGDYGNFGRGRWHPYLIGGMSRTWINMNSNYTGGSASTWDASGGAGVRLITDNLVSVRFEVLYHHMTVDFAPAAHFEKLYEGQVVVPVYEYVQGEGPRVISDFESHKLDTLSWALGFIATF